MITAYKLFRVRKDGSLGSLFANRAHRIPIGVYLMAEPHPTKGLAFRPGWHACPRPHAPHLSTRGRAWYKVELFGHIEHMRPAAQGGKWYTAGYMKVLDNV